jgi:hypothetical protein
MWHYDVYTGKWYIDHEGDLERENSCDQCDAVNTIGIDACSGCAG